MTATTYDKLGDVLSVSVSVNGLTTRTTSFSYDHLNRKIQETDPAVSVGAGLPTVTPTTTWSYDPNGNVLSTTDADFHTSYTVYDALNRPIRSVDALGSGPNDLAHATVTTYDPAGNVAAVTDADGNTTSYVRDRWNRPIQTLDALWNPTAVQYERKKGTRRRDSF